MGAQEPAAFLGGTHIIAALAGAGLSSDGCC